MKKIMLSGIALAASFALGAALPQTAHAQTVGQDARNAGHDTAHATRRVVHKTAYKTRVAAHDTAHGTRVAAHDTAHATRTGYHKTVRGTKRVGDKIADKPTPQ